MRRGRRCKGRLEEVVAKKRSVGSARDHHLLLHARRLLTRSTALLIEERNGCHSNVAGIRDV